MSSSAAGISGGASAGASATMDQMMGQMEAQNIQQMKNNLQMGRMSQEAAMSEALGKKFTLAKFHAIVLGDGTVPLALLENKVDAWIASAK